MKAEERTEAICKWRKDSSLKDHVLLAIKQAEADMKERCAKMAEEMSKAYDEYGSDSGAMFVHELPHRIRRLE